MSNIYKNSEFSFDAEHRLSELSYNRILVILLIFLLSFIGLSIRLCNIVLFNNVQIHGYQKKTSNFFVHRKEILDRNGDLLASNLKTVSLYANPKLILEAEETAKKLVQIFPHLKYDKLRNDLKSNHSFIWIKKHITPNEQYLVNNLGNPGLVFEKSEKRFYPHGNIFSHVIGYVGSDGNGLSAIEKYFDDTLKSSNYDDAKNNIQLSLDARVQNIVHSTLKSAMDQYKAEGAVGLIMNVNTGEILSMVSLPDFNPHEPGKAKKDNLFNRATLGVYELGSIFKICTIAIALDTQSVSLNDVYYVKNPLQASRFHIHDYKPSKHSWLSVPEIFMYSSNIGTARVALDIGAEKQKKYLKSFGLLDPAPVELVEVGSPLYPQEKKWNKISTITISYGHGIAISTLNALTAINAMINGGYLYKPTLLKIDNKENIEIHKVLNEKTSDDMRRLLRLVVVNGTGKKSDVDGYLVGGKTGSAEKAINGSYSKTQKFSSFAGAFPIHKPQYSILIMLDNPKNYNPSISATGGAAIAPIAKDIISQLGHILNIEPVNHYDEEIQKKMWINYKTDYEFLESF